MRKRERPKKPPAPEPLREVAVTPLNRQQDAAIKAIERGVITFLLGPAGTGKTHLACGWAVKAVADGRIERIVVTRPVVEAGESLGYLPGTYSDKVAPYLMPIYDAIDKLAGRSGRRRDQLNAATTVAPLAYIRGRSQPVDAKLLTPTGYRKMGDIRVGDMVIGSAGTPVAVLGVYPQGELEVYRVTFSDRTSVECSGDHLWQTSTLKQRQYGAHGVRTTLEIQRTAKTKFGQKVHAIPLSEPVQFAAGGPLPVDPYVLGTLLGDGNFHPKASITLANPEQEIVSRVSECVGAGLQLVAAKPRDGYSAQYRIVNVGGSGARNTLRSRIASLGLTGKLSHDKFVPQEYLLASIADRVSLLRGLMDTDGCVTEHSSGNSRVEFSSTSLRLAEDVRFLVHSLGGTASIRKRDNSGDKPHEVRGRLVAHRRPSYVVNMNTGETNPFHVSRKAGRWRPGRPLRLIASVESVGVKPCQCIKVDAADSLYLTEHCIVTHNTFDDSIVIVDEAQNCTLTQLRLVISRLGRGSKIILTGDLAQSDLPLRDQSLKSVVTKLSAVAGVEVFRFEASGIVRHPILQQVLAKL